MRWKKNKPPQNGDRKTTRKFPIIPLEFGDTSYWFETVKVEWEYTSWVETVSEVVPFLRATDKDVSGCKIVGVKTT